jgi:hypothetical protein
MEVAWEIGGNITGRLFDSDGTTLLNTVTGNSDLYTSGGIAFRSFDSTKYFDTVEVLPSGAPETFYTSDPDVYSFTLDGSERATVALTSLGRSSLDLDLWNAATGDWDEIVTDASNVDRVVEIPPGSTEHFVRIRGAGTVEGSQYSLVVTRDAHFELAPNSGPEPRNGVDPCQAVAVSLDSPVIALGNIGGASSGDAVVGYFTDNNPDSTGPEGAIVQAGFTPVQISDISTFDLTTVDILMVDESSNGGPSAAMQDRLGDIEAWVTRGGMFMVHDRFVTDDAGDPQSNPFLVGAPEIQLDRDLTNGADIDVIPPANTFVTDGPHGVIDDGTLDGGNYSNHGLALEETFPAEAVSILSAGPVDTPNNVAAFSYPLQSGWVYYSSIPLDWYRGGDNNFNNIYAPNALVYGYSLIVPEVDFYAVDVPAGTTQLLISTLTPAAGTGEFVNTLDTKICLYDSLGNQVATADNSDSDLDAQLSYLIPTGGEGTYYIEVLASDDPSAEPKQLKRCTSLFRHDDLSGLRLLRGGVAWRLETGNYRQCQRHAPYTQQLVVAGYLREWCKCKDRRLGHECDARRRVFPCLCSRPLLP